MNVRIATTSRNLLTRSTTSRPGINTARLYISCFSGRTSPYPFANRPRPYRTSTRHQASPHLVPSSLTLTTLALGLICAGAGLAIWDSYQGTQKHQSSNIKASAEEGYPARVTFTAPVDPLLDMPISPEIATQIPPGRPGNLTPDQEAKLKDLWYEIGKLCGLYTDGPRPSAELVNDEADDSEGSGTKVAGKDHSSSGSKKKRRFFGRKSRDSESIRSGSVDDADDKHGSNKEFRAAISSMSQEELRTALWEFSKCDDPDANLCRYLRARKWNVHDALVMLISTIHWRERVMKLDSDVMMKGEEQAMLALKGHEKEDMDPSLANDMLQQLRMGKSFLHGVDKEGRPLCYVRVRLHKGGEFSDESLQRLTVYMIETARFMLRPPVVDTAVIIFDMTGFTLANMDYTPVKFMIKVFEANYPESLGAVLVHKAPWVFQGIWSVIKGWLDPVVASKIHFTKTVDDLEDYISRGNIPHDLGGEEDWEYKYVEPIEGENRQMQDKQALKETLEERKEVTEQFEKATQDWVLGTGDEKEVQERRAKLSRRMNETYWNMDPFIRSRSMYDRTGVIKDGGKLDFYPSEKARVQQTQQVDDAAERKPLQTGGMLGGPSLRSPASARLQQDDDAKSIASVYYDAQSELD